MKRPRGRAAGWLVNLESATDTALHQVLGLVELTTRTRREQETEPCQTGLRRALRKQRVRMPPGDYRYCAFSTPLISRLGVGCDRLRTEQLELIGPNSPRQTASLLQPVPVRL